MTTHVPTRQPFAALDSPRLQSLSNIKNRQNAIPASFSPSQKPTHSTATKRRYSPSVFDSDNDSENIEPSIFNSPTKRSKTTDGLAKPSQFITTTQSARTSPTTLPSPRKIITPTLPSVRKALSSPSTASSTPIGSSRGSPKHKRVGLLSKRRASSSQFRRIDPPAFSPSMANGNSGLPFSIDAALSGTIPTYTPKPAVAAMPTLEEAMPKTWFFDIHEDTPEEEATNLMEHSACTLDISSDDDGEMRKAREGAERGKENIPPPDFVFASTSIDAEANVDDVATEMTGLEGVGAIHEVKLPKLRRPLVQDAMDQDRSPLSDLPAKDYYGPGCDESSFVTVDAAIEKPSGLSKEFDFAALTSPSPLREEELVGEEKPVEVEAPVEAEVLVEVEALVEAPVETLIEAQLPVETEVEVPVQVEQEKEIPIYVDETAGPVVKAPVPVEAQTLEEVAVLVSLPDETDEEL
ncbi:uncharacterized protein BDZ99DRAFT_471556 [Mytilinidion resinicola]|uniref:Uncharacterized protein n=1 Tax=Mytilinidion resinicola TaxID=574789 RepID=A0A6A6Z679_9PEZI|nr:uncharacterized protein BDZ99DRAFT_471556 [Mytilinidion resinicola]KAF2816318.1 hypothetical protein BDZ99DRAFT_471556 [Mytilinidion resinicola]